MQMVDVVAIDGPVGVGKSTVARHVAATLGFRHLDTGAMYRAVAWKILADPAIWERPEDVANVARDMRLDMCDDGSLWLDGQDITTAIREEQVSRNVFRAADNRGVREALVAEQRRLGIERPSVLEGRDICTVVFPDARWKFYLDASPEVRVQRRAAQLTEMGKPAPHSEILASLLDRDERDRRREWGALKVDPQAMLIDTTDLDEGSVVGIINAIVRESQLAARQLAGAHG